MKIPGAGSLLLTTLLPSILAASGPIRTHPENPHYFEWRGRAVALFTSASSPTAGGSTEPTQTII